MRKRVAGLTATALVAAATVLAGAPAMADTPGFAIRITQAPTSFSAGRGTDTLTAVVTSNRGGGCQRVRWALIISTQGVSLDQVRVNRVEDGQPFAVRAEVDADAAQVVDADFDPGLLCRDRTVTARWDLGFVGPDAGRATFRVAALNEGGRLLASANVSSSVTSQATATATPTTPPSGRAEPTDAPTTPADDATTPTDAAPAVVATTPTGDQSGGNPTAVARNTGVPSLLGPGLIVGAVLVFLGVTVLMRLRMRNRRTPDVPDEMTATMPAGYYNMPAG